MPTAFTRGAASARAFGLFKAVSGAVTDAYFKYVTMLLPGNGTNGAQNNTFLDSSTNNFSITRNGNTTQGTFAPYGSNWSNYFDGSGDYLSVANNAALNVLGSSFTIEFWFYLTAAQGNYGLVSKHDGSGGYIIRLDTTIIRFFTSAATVDRTYTFSQGTWYHVAVVSNGTTGTLYVNGVAQGATFSTNGTNATTALQIGRTNTITNDFPGYISNVRITNTVVYSGAFTPSTVSLTAISGTALLTCQSNRFIDNSSNAFAITVNGDTSVQVFSPFSPSAAYSTTTIGGSGYFDGTGDYLSVADSATLELGSSDFCIEGWYYPTTFASSLALVSKRTNSTSTGAFVIFANSGAGSLTFYASTNGSSYFWSGATVGTLVLNQWNHFAVYRSGNNWYGAINGTVSSMGSSANSIYNNTNAWTIGGDTDANYANGYMSNVRFVIGSAVYTSANFTPPTSPLTAITNTSLLVNFTNAGVIDNAMMNDLETVGNAQISTTQSKFGGSSMYFDGTSDGLNAADSPQFDMGSGDFTIEMWIYPLNLSGSGASAEQFLIGQNNSSTYYAPFRVMFAGNGGQLVAFFSTTGSSWTLRLEAGSTSTISANNWYHIAIVRNGTSVKIYVNGTQYDSGTLSGALYNSTDIMRIGWANIGAGEKVFNGYIDDLRITKGYARYTANFTAPTAAFPTQ